MLNIIAVVALHAVIVGLFVLAMRELRRIDGAREPVRVPVKAERHEPRRGR